jgi:hypothetical protein
MKKLVFLFSIMMFSVASFASSNTTKLPTEAPIAEINSYEAVATLAECTLKTKITLGGVAEVEVVVKAATCKEALKELKSLVGIE